VLAIELTVEQGRALLSTFDRISLRGKRDYAMVAVLLGCGLRRAELAAAQVQDVQQREDHWVFADLIGKGGHIRTVPIPDWVAEAVRAWMTEACITAAAVFRPINKAGRIGTNGSALRSFGASSKKLLLVADLPMLPRTTFAGRAHAYAIKPGENSTRFNSYSATSASRQPSVIWAANSG
jgi:integrase